MIDVAERAGVTVSTASRALARPEMVRPETRARVEAAAEALGYVPNRVARSLITGSSATIAIVVPQLVSAYFAEICHAGQVAARERGYATFIVDSGSSPQQERETMRRLIAGGIDGIIICAASSSYAPGDTPIVFVNRLVRGSHAVLLDQFQIVNTQIEHLRFLGHRRIAWIAGPKGYWTSSIRHRHIERLRVRFPIEIIEGIPPTFEGGQEVVKHLDPSITAVAAFTDSQASGILSAAAEHGIPVPEDLSVIGSDGTRLGEMVTPPLTTVQSPLEQMAKSAVSLLLDHLRDERAATIVETLPVELVVRSSTAPLPVSSPPIKVEDK